MTGGIQRDLANAQIGLGWGGDFRPMRSFARKKVRMMYAAENTAYIHKQSPKFAPT